MNAYNLIRSRSLDDMDANIIKDTEVEEMVEKRFKLFIASVNTQINQNIDSAKYEDLARALFKSKAYLVFHLDKMLINTPK